MIIIGGGPTGSVAGSLLAKNGFKVLIIEKQKHPRWKACGEAISMEGIQLFRQYELFEAIEGLLHEIHGIAIDVIDEAIVNLATIRSEKPMEYTTDRAAFDRTLFEYAGKMGAEIHDGEKFIALTPGTEEIGIETSEGHYRGRVLIGADGAYSKVGRLLLRKWGPGELVGAKVARYRLDSDDPRFDPEIMGYYFIKGGYCWIFPRVEKESKILNIGIAGLGLDDNARRALFDTFLTKIEEARTVELKGKEIDGKIWSHVIPIQGPCRGTYTDRCLLIGDAGGFVNPLTGGGLHFGVHSAIHAAETITQYLEKKIESLSHYEELWSSDIKPAFDGYMKIRAMLTSMEVTDLEKLVTANPSMKQELFGKFLGH